MKKQVIGAGMEFFDDFNAKHGGISGVRAVGKKIEVFRGGSWQVEHICNDNVDTLLWHPNGKVEAVLDNGKVVTAGAHLTPTPNKYSLRKIEIQEGQGDSSSKSSSKKSSSGGSTKSSGFTKKLWKYPLKALWWVIKAVFVVGILGALAGGGDNKKKGK